MQTAFHQRLGIAVADQGYGHRRCLVAVFDVDDAMMVQIQPEFRGDGSDFCFRSNQNRIDKAGLGRHQGAF